MEFVLGTGAPQVGGLSRQGGTWGRRLPISTTTESEVATFTKRMPERGEKASAEAPNVWVSSHYDDRGKGNSMLPNVAMIFPEWWAIWEAEMSLSSCVYTASAITEREAAAGKRRSTPSVGGVGSIIRIYLQQ